MPPSLPCASAPPPPRPTGQRSDSWDPFLLRNINDFPLPPRAGNRHQLALPTQTAGCQPACPLTSPRTTWEEATPQAGSGFMVLPAWLPEQAVEPHPAFLPCYRQSKTPSTDCGGQGVMGSLIKATLSENLLHAAPATISPKFRTH